MEAKDVTEMKQNRNSREYVLEAVRKKGKLLEFQDDEEVVKTALTQDGEAMEFVSKRLRNNKELVLLAINGAPWTACYASEALKADKEVIMESVKTYGQTLYYAS